MCSSDLKGSSSVEGVKITLGGNTYNNRDSIKSAGFKWDPENKVWSKSYIELASFPNLSKKNARDDLEKVGNMQETSSEPASTPEPSSAPAGELTAGSEITDKKGNKGVIKKINKDNYAYVKFEDGKEGWRSLNSINGTGNVDTSYKNIIKTKTAKITGAGVEPVKVSEPAEIGRAHV